MPTSNENAPPKNPTDQSCFVSSCDVFSVAGAIALLLCKELNKCQLETVMNILTLLTANLNAIIAQEDINSGDFIEPNI